MTSRCCSGSSVPILELAGGVASVLSAGAGGDRATTTCYEAAAIFISNALVANRS